MATQWNTLTVRVSDADKSAMDTIRGEQSVNAFLSQLLKDKIRDEFNPTPVPSGKGFPLQGRAFFKYRPDRDNFVWQLDLGPRGTFLLAEDVSYAFIEALGASVDAARKERERFLNGVPDGHVVIPAGLERLGVR